MSVDDMVSHFPSCPNCGFAVFDYEPGVSSRKYDDQWWHQECLPAEADEERHDLTIRRLEKSIDRQEWMCEAHDLLLKAGISDNLVAQAREAYANGLTPIQFATNAIGSTPKEAA